MAIIFQGTKSLNTVRTAYSNTTKNTGFHTAAPLAAVHLFRLQPYHCCLFPWWGHSELQGAPTMAPWVRSLCGTTVLWDCSYTHYIREAATLTTLLSTASSTAWHIILFIFQIRQQRKGRGWGLTQGQRASKSENLDLNPTLPNFKTPTHSMTLSLIFHIVIGKKNEQGNVLSC